MPPINMTRRWGITIKSGILMMRRKNYQKDQKMIKGEETRREEVEEEEEEEDIKIEILISIKTREEEKG